MPSRQRISAANRGHLEHFVATIEQQRSQSVSDADIERIRAELASADERVRARAVRSVCPCRMPWPVFLRLRKAVARLRRDPSPLVRARAQHVEVDARTVREREATVACLREQEERRIEKRSQSGGGRRYG